MYMLDAIRKQETHGPHRSHEEDCHMFLISFYKFAIISPSLKDVALYLNKSEFPLPRDTLC